MTKKIDFFKNFSKSGPKNGILACEGPKNPKISLFLVLSAQKYPKQRLFNMMGSEPNFLNIMKEPSVGQTQPKIQDTGCDHNNIRPLCVIQNPISYTKVCPQKLGISHCGDNVKKVTLAVVYGQASSDVHFWGNFNGNENYQGNLIEAFGKVVAALKKDQEQNPNVNPFLQNWV